MPVASEKQAQKNAALIEAVEKDDAKSAKIALKEGADANTRWFPPSGKLNYTALQLAIHRKSLAVVKVLLKSEKIDVNALDSFGDTALTTAAATFQPNIVKILLGHPTIDTSIPDRANRTPWDIARKDATKNGNMIRKLLAKKEGNSLKGEKKRER